MTPVALRAVPAGTRHYETADPPSLVIGSDSDPDGVAKYLLNGVAYDHPVRQASTALAMLNGYRLTGDPAYLDRAVRNADRLIATGVSDGGALYFPYPFSFALHSNKSETMKPPWYSAMAQGQALSAFTRLFEVTGDARWRAAADAAFESLKIKGPRIGKPWVVHLDASGYLWLEEYPFAPKPDRTFNGHLFAVLGLYDYWQMTHDPNALLLVRGALATVRAYSTAWRLPGGVSRYCMAHVVRNIHYHVLHTDLAYSVYHVTGTRWWAMLGDGFLADYPDYESVYGPVRFAATTHTGYKFDSAGRVVAHRTVVLVRASGADASSRRRVLGRSGVYLAISNGTFAGYLVPERPGLSYIRGIVYRIPWDPVRKLDVRKGTYTAFSFTADGSIDRRVAATMSATTRMHVAERAIILGRLHYRIIDGPWAGLWLPAGSGITLY